MITCPVCNKPTTHSTLDGVPMDNCGEHGTWLDRGELLEVTNAERFKPVPFWENLFRREIRPPAREGRTLKCPKCTSDMEPFLYHGVTIDWCREHGVWLDAAEMEAILNNLRLDPSYMRGVALRLVDREL